MRLDRAALYFGRDGRGMLFSREEAFHVSVDCYDTARPGHLKFEIGIVRHRIEASKCGLSEQCVVATTEGNDAEDQVFTSEVVWRTKDDFQCY